MNFRTFPCWYLCPITELWVKSKVLYRHGDLPHPLSLACSMKPTPSSFLPIHRVQLYQPICSTALFKITNDTAWSAECPSTRRLSTTTTSDVAWDGYVFILFYMTTNVDLHIVNRPLVRQSLHYVSLPLLTLNHHDDDEGRDRSYGSLHHSNFQQRWRGVVLETSKNTDVNLKESNNIIIKRILKIIFLLNFIGVMLLINGPLYHGSESRPRAPAVLFRFRRDPSGRMRLCQLVCIFSPLSAHLIGMSRNRFLAFWVSWVRCLGKGECIRVFIGKFQRW